MLQQTSLDKEEKRILAMRARAEARTQKFLNARSRTIGIDLDGLNAQVEEKRLLREAEKKAAADQGECSVFGLASAPSYQGDSEQQQFRR